MKFQWIWIALLLVGCAEPESPSQFYERYNQRVIDGISFADDAAHFSARKRAQVEARLAALPAGESGREQMIASYLQFSREVARCKTLQLQSQQVQEQRAELLYAQTDSCGKAVAEPEKHKVILVWEDGWKIDEVEIAL
ncbi:MULTISPECIES: hypothetical protein [Pseudomonadaceae]|jgi:hypothetical protein|uniref:hypothetical protein n=1 Tax=Pseudomonadaceae TaxID=135621 RepID=UPI00147354F0|nr:hypothetical protein [Pseudomonas sp. WS 5013]NMY41550.1 hypothetical protein [Pseudomonas sp. WS 5013]